MAETRTISARKGNSDAGSEPPAKPQRTRITKRKANENHARSYFEAIANRDVDGVLSHWSDEGVIDLVPLGVLRGSAQIRGFFRELFGAFPDAEMTVTRLAAGQSEVAVEWRMSATFTGEPFQGVEATGRPVELRGIDLIEIEDGKNVSNTAYYDGMAFGRAVGLLPQQDSSAERAMKGAVNAVTKARRVVADLRYRTAA
jgi:steroid delta-isomerase-like uncharacterized protein